MMRDMDLINIVIKIAWLVKDNQGLQPFIPD